MSIDALPAGSDAPPAVWPALPEGTDSLRWRLCLAADIEAAEFALAGGGTYEYEFGLDLILDSSERARRLSTQATS